MTPGIYSTKFESKDGTRRRVREMTTSHLHNLRKWLDKQDRSFRFPDEMLPECFVSLDMTYEGFNIDEWIEAIDYELKKRNGHDPNCPLNRAMVGLSSQGRELQSKQNKGYHKRTNG